MRIKFSSPADSPRIGNFSKPAAPREIPPGYPPYVCGGGASGNIFLFYCGPRGVESTRTPAGDRVTDSITGFLVGRPGGGWGDGKNTVDSITDRCRRAAVYHNILTIHPLRNTRGGSRESLTLLPRK